MSSLPAVPAFDFISKALSPTGLLAVLELTGVAVLILAGVAVLELTRGLLGILFLSTVIDKVLGQKFPYTQVQLPMMPSLNLLDPHNHNLESLSSWHTS